jgi:hypothetical protein
MSNVQLITKRDIKELSVVGKSLEVIDWVLYDTLTIATGGTQTAFRYFQQSQGQAGVSLAQTNLEIPGQLPAGYKFVCQKIVLTPATNLALTAAGVKDQVAVSHRGSAQLFIGTRPYLQTPVQNLVGGALVGFSSAFDAATALTYGAARTVINGEMEYSPVIPANFSFSLLIQYDAAPTVSASLTLAAQMVGKLIRPRQG